MPPTNSTTPERLRGFFAASAAAFLRKTGAAIQHKAKESCSHLKNPPVTERMLGFVLGLGLRLGLARVSHDQSADRASAVKVRTARKLAGYSKKAKLDEYIARPSAVLGSLLGRPRPACCPSFSFTAAWRATCCVRPAWSRGRLRFYATARTRRSAMSGHST